MNDQNREIAAKKPGGRALPAVASALLVLGMLAAVQLRAPRPMLLAERFLPGAGWLEALLLAAYAALITHKLMDPAQTARWRRRIWALFSLVFFAQLALALSGVEQCWMNPQRMHFPIPALIAAGPIYRGGGYFMLALLGVTLLLVGPAWCSHICYLGAWDQAASGARRKPGELPRWHQKLRGGLLLALLAAAWGLRAAGAPPALAGGLALAFGLVGVALMLLWSRRAGVMAHCVAYCPVGLLATWLGRVSPFRLRIDRACDDCMRCRPACRYAALAKDDIARRRPGSSCTLCGDCLGTCPHQALHYRFAGLGPARARALFITLTVALHAATLGLARI